MFVLRPFDCMQNDALERMRLFLMSADDVNHQFKDLEGATQLWKAAELGCHLAVKEILQHPNIEPNTTHKGTGTTPFYIALGAALTTGPKKKCVITTSRKNKCVVRKGSGACGGLRACGRL